jgi:hypothetical protein
MASFFPDPCHAARPYGGRPGYFVYTLSVAGVTLCAPAICHVFSLSRSTFTRIIRKTRGGYIRVDPVEGLVASTSKSRIRFAGMHLRDFLAKFFREHSQAQPNANRRFLPSRCTRPFVYNAYRVACLAASLPESAVAKEANFNKVWNADWSDVSHKPKKGFKRCGVCYGLEELEDKAKTEKDQRAPTLFT